MGERGRRYNAPAAQRSIPPGLVFSVKVRNILVEWEREGGGITPQCSATSSLLVFSVNVRNILVEWERGVRIPHVARNMICGQPLNY